MSMMILHTECMQKFVNKCNELVRVGVDCDFTCRTFVNICNELVRVEVDGDFACRTDSQMCSLILQSQRFHHFPLRFDLGNLSESDTFLINIVQPLVLSLTLYHYICHCISYHWKKIYISQSLIGAH